MDANIRAQDPALFFATHTPITVRKLRLASGVVAADRETFSECDILNLIYEPGVAVGNRVFLFSGGTGMGKTELCQWLGFMLERKAPQNYVHRCSHEDACSYGKSSSPRDVIRVMKEWDFVEVVQRLVEYANRFARPGEAIALDCDFDAIRYDLRENPNQYAFQLGSLVFRDLYDTGWVDSGIGSRTGDSYLDWQTKFCRFLAPVFSNLVNNKEDAPVEVLPGQVREAYDLKFLTNERRGNGADTAAYITERLLFHLREQKRMPSPKEVLRQVVTMLHQQRGVRPVLIIEDIAKLSIDRVSVINYLQDLGSGEWDVVIAGTDEYIDQLDIDTLQERFSRFSFGKNGSQSEFCRREQAPAFFAPYLEFVRDSSECARCEQAALCAARSIHSLFPFTPQFITNMWDSPRTNGGRPRHLVQSLFTLLSEAEQHQERGDAVALAAEELRWVSHVRVNPALRERNPVLYAHAKWYGRFDQDRSVTLLDATVTDFFGLDTEGFERVDGRVVIPFAERQVAAEGVKESEVITWTKPVVDAELLRLQDGVARWQQRSSGDADVGDYIRQGALHVITFMTNKGQIAYGSDLSWQWRLDHIQFDDEVAAAGAIVVARSWPAEHFSRLVEIGYECAKPEVKEGQRSQRVVPHLQQCPGLALRMGALASDWTRASASFIVNDTGADVRRIVLATYILGVQMAMPEQRVTAADLGQAYRRVTAIPADFWADLCSPAHTEVLKTFSEQWSAFKALFAHFCMDGDLADLGGVSTAKDSEDLVEWAYSYLISFPRSARDRVAVEWAVGGKKVRDLVDSAWLLGHRVLSGEGSIHRQNFRGLADMRAQVERILQAAQELISPDVQNEMTALRRMADDVRQLNTVFGPQLLRYLGEFAPMGRDLEELVERCRGLMMSLSDDRFSIWANALIMAGGHKSILAAPVVCKINDLWELLTSWGAVERASLGSTNDLDEVLHIMVTGGAEQ